MMFPNLHSSSNMPSSRSSGRGYRRRIKKKQKLASTSKTSSKPPKISSVTLPKPKADCSKSFAPTERDLESDEAVWDLYNRWCLYHKIHRTLEEMQLRFIYFKKSAISVFEINENYKNNKSSFSQYLSQFCDRTDKEWKRKRNSKYIG